MIGARLADRAIGLVGTVILARVLTPADFGLVAMAMAIIGLIELASAFGFEMTLLRNPNPTPAQYNTVWTLNVMFGFGSGLVTALAAVPAADFYSEPRLIPIMLVLGAAWAFGSLENIGIVDFRRTLNFAKEFRFLLTRRVVGSAVTITLALLTRSYWALIIGALAMRSTGLLLSYLWHPFRPKLSLSERGEVFSFSAWIFVEKLGAFGFMRASDFVLGRTHGAREVGIYRLGEEIGHLPSTELIAPINRALYPGIAQMSAGGRGTRDIVLAANGVVGLMLFPACLGISAVASLLVPVMLGGQWGAAIPIVQILAMNSMLMALWANQHTLLLALGRPHITAFIAIARLCVFAVVLWLVVREHGAQGAALSLLVGSAAALVLGLSVSLREHDVGLRDYASVLWRPLLAGGAMWFCVTWFVERHAVADGALAPFIRLLAAVGIGVAVYMAAMGLLYVVSGKPEGAERQLVRQLTRWIRPG